MAIPLAEHLSGILGGAFHPVAAMKPDTVVDWNKLILDGIRAKILDESIREVETCQVSAVKVAECRDNPVFGSW